jgi:hypothetical protein
MPTFVKATLGSISLKRSVAKVVMEPINYYILVFAKLGTDGEDSGSREIHMLTHQFEAELV